jgi:hypothetical protein
MRAAPQTNEIDQEDQLNGPGHLPRAPAPGSTPAIAFTSW